MSKLSLFAAAALVAAPLSIAAASAQQEMRAEAPYGYGAQPYANTQSYGSWGSDGGLGRYCPPGQYPHSFPNGNGVRCETPYRGY